MDSLIQQGKAIDQESTAERACPTLPLPANCPGMMTPATLIPALLLLLSSALFAGEVPRHSYEAAASYVRSHYKAETMMERSTAIYKVEYYPAEGQNFMLVYLQTDKSNGYIYEGVPSSVWNGWKKAESKGRYYHASVKGRYKFRLQK